MGSYHETFASERKKPPLVRSRDERICLTIKAIDDIEAVLTNPGQLVDMNLPEIQLNARSLYRLPDGLASSYRWVMAHQSEIAGLKSAQSGDYAPLVRARLEGIKAILALQHEQEALRRASHGDAVMRKLCALGDHLQFLMAGQVLSLTDYHKRVAGMDISQLSEAGQAGDTVLLSQLEAQTQSALDALNREIASTLGEEEARQRDWYPITLATIRTGLHQAEALFSQPDAIERQLGKPALSDDDSLKAYVEAFISQSIAELCTQFGMDAPDFHCKIELVPKAQRADYPYACYLSGSGQDWQLQINPAAFDNMTTLRNSLRHEIAGHAMNFAFLHQRINDRSMPKCLGLTTVFDSHSAVSEAIAQFIPRYLSEQEALSPAERLIQDVNHHYGDLVAVARSVATDILAGHMPQSVRDELKITEPADTYSQEQLLAYAAAFLTTHCPSRARAFHENYLKMVCDPKTPGFDATGFLPRKDRHFRSYNAIYTVSQTAMQRIYEEVKAGGEAEEATFASFLKDLYTHYLDYPMFCELARAYGYGNCLSAPPYDVAAEPRQEQHEKSIAALVAREEIPAPIREELTTALRAAAHSR